MDTKPQRRVDLIASVFAPADSVCHVPRHLLIVLLVPDKNGIRNLVAAFALVVPVLLPGVRFGATLPIATVLLFFVLGWHLRAIGWPTVAADGRHPLRTIRLMLGAREGA